MKTDMKTKEKKMRIVLFLLGLCILLVSPVMADSMPEFLIMTEESPPYNFEKDDQVMGIAVDMMVLMLERIGSKQRRENIVYWPWARGYKKIQNTPNTILFSTTRTEERENMFKWVCSIVEIKQLLFAAKNRNIKINSKEDLKKYRIGTYLGDVTEQLLVSKVGLNLKDFDRSSKAINSVKKLARNRNDMVAANEESFFARVEQAGLNKDDYEPVYTLSNNRICYAFHKDIPDSIIQKFQNALDELKKEGKYDEIMKKYKQ